MRSVARRASVLGLLVALLPLQRGWASEQSPDVRVVVDYLTPLVYYREKVSLRLRVENPWSADVRCTLRAALDTPTKPSAPPLEVVAAVKGRRDLQTGFELDSRKWSSARVTYEFNGESHHVVTIRRFDEDGEIPKLAARGERLYVAGTDEVAVVAMEQRTSQPDREWYLWKKFAERLGEGELPAGVVLLTAKLWEGEDEGPSYVRKVREGARTWVEATVLPGETAQGVLHPVLADLAAGVEALSSGRRAELVLWVAACDDARRATPKRVYRKAADLLMTRAHLRGASRLAVLFVPEPAVPGDRRSLYSEQLRAATRAYRGTFERVSEMAEAECWVSPSAVESRSLMRYPNVEGLKALADAVLARIKR